MHAFLQLLYDYTTSILELLTHSLTLHACAKCLKIAFWSNSATLTSVVATTVKAIDVETPSEMKNNYWWFLCTSVGFIDELQIMEIFCSRITQQCKNFQCSFTIHKWCLKIALVAHVHIFIIYVHSYTYLMYKPPLPHSENYTELLLHNNYGCFHYCSIHGGGEW